MFRFTIRELVLLTLVAAMGVAWWLDRRRLHARVTFLERGAEFVIATENIAVKVDERPWPGN